MAVYICKKCGGDVRAADKSITGTCPACGYEQTLPRIGGADRQDLFERAGRLRLDKKYIEALRLYQDALEADDSDPETHWLAVLCKYKVEYVDDPQTHSRVIKCNKPIRKSIMADDDYAACLANATDYARRIYEAEAAEIDRIQMEELAIIDGRGDFDVFVSFKQRDAQDRITKDCLRAEQIYNTLADEGYKVFFSKVTLEDRLSFDWKGFIDAAIGSAKVMVAVGTSSDNYDAKWVKYEWSKFLELAEEDPYKRLIPAYEDIRASELPDEFAKFQAVNMAVANYTYSIVRNVRSLIGAAPDSQIHLATTADDDTLYTSVPPAIKEDIKIADNKKIPQIMRAFQMCEDEDFVEAKKHADDVLATVDAENEDAFLVKLMVDYECRQEEELGQLFIDDLSNNRNYQRAYKFGDEQLKSRLDEYDRQAKENYNLPLEERAKRLEDSLGEIVVGSGDSQISTGWRVLSIDDVKKRALVIAQECIAAMPYHEPGGSITWEVCTLRYWLNGEFYNSILPEGIKRRAIEVENRNPDSRWDTPGGNATPDKVFLLSADEARSYFADDSDRTATYQGENAWWWLRSPGDLADYAAIVGYGGVVNELGSLVGSSYGVRPALWLSL